MYVQETNHDQMLKQLDVRMCSCTRPVTDTTSTLQLYKPLFRSVLSQDTLCAEELSGHGHLSSSLQI
jgi:hypothetical protein